MQKLFHPTQPGAMPELYSFESRGNKHSPGRRSKRKMSIGEILAWGAGSLAVLGTFIEVSKIKINPWSSLLKWIGNKMMADVKEDVKEIKKEQEEIKKKQEELEKQRASDAADVIKAEVFAFYNECKRKMKHSEAEFNHIIRQNKKYQALIEITKEPNGVYEAEYEYIIEIYKQARSENDFL